MSPRRAASTFVWQAVVWVVHIVAGLAQKIKEDDVPNSQSSSKTRAMPHNSIKMLGRRQQIFGTGLLFALCFAAIETVGSRR